MGDKKNGDFDVHAASSERGSASESSLFGSLRGRIATSVIFVSFAWFLGWLTVGDDVLLVRWGAFAAPWLAVLVFAASVFADRWWLRISAILLVVLILTPVLPRLSPARWFRVARPGDLRVMTFNTSASNRNYDGIASLIVRQHPDVVMLQQIQDLPALLSAIRHRPGHLDYQGFPSHTADTVILSRLPLAGGFAKGRMTAAVVAVGACRIHLWNLHAPHGQITPGYQTDFFLAAAEGIGRAGLPVIAAGDLNSTEFNSVQAPLRTSLRDAYADAGAGLGLTFPANVRRFGILGRLFRIDHVFYQGALHADWIKVLDDNASSDHFPTVADFAISTPCR